MKNTTRNIVVTLVFCVFIAFFVVLCAVCFADPAERSEAERRPLAQFPTNITWNGIFGKDKTVIDEFESYTVDQFPMREFFRTLKARFVKDVLRLKENNGLAVENGYIAKIESDFNDTVTNYSLGRLKYVYNKYLADNGGEKYFCLVPDKNYFFGRDYGYPMPDYGALAEKIGTELPDFEYIDIFDTLSLEDYYRTDTHWRQEKLGGVVNKVAESLGVADSLSGSYTENRLDGFKGVYHGQSALDPEPDTLVYLTNDVLDGCTVYDYETGITSGIYDFPAFEGTDGYDLFLSGTRSMLRIDNPSAEVDKELVIFRDSFGSSFSPLLAEAYKSIYILDIRYVLPDALGMQIDFEGKDVLFLYSALILNQKAFK